MLAVDEEALDTLGLEASLERILTEFARLTLSDYQAIDRDRLLGADLREAVALAGGCKSHPANSLQPEATGAVMEGIKQRRRIKGLENKWDNLIP